MITPKTLRVPPALEVAAEALLSGPNPLRKIAELLSDRASDATAAELATCALALRQAAPTDRVLWCMTDGPLFSQLPKYHWGMVTDHNRNAAYKRAINNLVEPGMTVLEIGAGSGLLAMMAARAGAVHVYTIEADPVMATVARQTVERNGFGDRITVIDGFSTKMEVGDTLPRRADMLVHEVLSSDVLSEGVLVSVEHAKRELLTPDALLLPHGIGAAGALANPKGGRLPAEELVEDFDLSALAYVNAAIHACTPGLCTRLSNPIRLLDTDLREDFPLNQKRTVRAKVTQDGTLMGIEQWMVVGFPDGTLLSTDDPTSHWGAGFHPLGETVEVHEGQTVTIHIDQGPTRLSFVLAD
ncbi:MAG: 50S ribosomal protein L11 methyltransferase [Pseudomonadota bacterium]